MHKARLLICSLGRGTGSGGQRDSHQLCLNFNWEIDLAVGSMHRTLS